MGRPSAPKQVCAPRQSSVAGPASALRSSSEVTPHDPRPRHPPCVRMERGLLRRHGHRQRLRHGHAPGQWQWPVQLQGPG